MGDREKLKRDLEALAALLADIAKQLESESGRSSIKELHRQCLLELALMEKAENNDPE
jgi:hypothetical protein